MPLHDQTTLREAPKLIVGQRVKFGHYDNAPDSPHFLEGEVVEPFRIWNEGTEEAIVICRIKPSQDTQLFAWLRDDGRLWLDGATVVNDDGTVHCLPNEVTP